MDNNVELIHRGPIVLIGLNKDGQTVKYKSWPVTVYVDHAVLDRIAPFLKDSVLLCEHYEGELYVWGVVNTANGNVISMLATEMTAEMLNLKTTPRAQPKGPRRMIIAPPTLQDVIVRPEKAFPLSDLGQKVYIRQIDGQTQIIPLQLEEE